VLPAWPAVAAAVSHEMRNTLGLRVDVTPVAVGELLSGDPKAHWFTDHRAGRSES
jgi:hypothetical protein